MTAGSTEQSVALRRAVADDWPFTRRPLPWLLAGFLFMLWFVPIAGVDLKVSLPFDAKIDRFAIALVVLGWMLFGGDRRPRGKRPWLFLAALVTFVGIAFLSVIVHAPRVIRVGEFDLAQKQLAVLVSLALFAWFAVNAMRPSELRAFSLLTVWMASLCALGVVVERRTGFNVFYEVSHAVLSPIANVVPSPTDVNPDPTKYERPAIVGPTEHGLAVTTMLSIALPFALIGLLDAKRLGRKAVYGIAVCLILAAALSTARKTAVVVPLVIVLVIVLYRPREMLRLWPLALVMAAVIHVGAPGALGTIAELDGFLDTASSQGRTTDYAAVRPDIVTRPVLGYGFGAVDIADPLNYRILDNEYLAQLLQVGLVGLAAYLMMIAAAMASAHRAIRSGAPGRASPALAASAGVAGYAAASALFDILSFPQAPYMFLFAAAVCTVSATGVGRQQAPKARPTSMRPVVAR